MTVSRRDRTVRRQPQASRMRLVGRATESMTLRRASAGPLPPGRGFCRYCWRDFMVSSDGWVRAHGCLRVMAVVFEGPLLPPLPKAAVAAARTHAPGVYGDGKARCGARTDSFDADEPTCARCQRVLAHEIRAIGRPSHARISS